MFDLRLSQTFITPLLFIFHMGKKYMVEIFPATSNLRGLENSILRLLADNKNKIINVSYSHSTTSSSFGPSTEAYSALVLYKS